MRKQDKVILWPVYFDLNRTRSDGRRVTKKLGVPAPTVEEIRKAAEQLGFQPEVVSEAAYPSAPWQKSGLVAVSKKDVKVRIIRRIAQKIVENRAQT
jgi:signal recognition particle subunit SRP19